MKYLIVSFLAVVPLLMSSCNGAPANAPWTSSKVERRKQGITMDNMRIVGDLVRMHRKDHQRDPASLDQIVKAYTSAPRLAIDGWNRELYYHSTGDSFVIASFGRNGTPESLQCDPGCFAGAKPPMSAYDVDIVMIDGVWAQTPVGLGR
jgi:hypothetical protein